MSGVDTGCADMALLIQADQDGELSAAESASVLSHVAGCAGCAALRVKLAGLSAAMRHDSLRYAASDRLRRSIAPDASMSRLISRAWTRRHAAGALLGAALAACVVLALPRPAARDLDVAGVVDGHLRGLQPGHLLDVVSTDRHTVKPWFDGRLDYAPPVRDFAAAGFPLKGARLDVLKQRPVAVLVYGRDKHLIDVFVFPGGPMPARRAALRGYNLVAWTADGMSFWAVSDLNAADLAGFAQLWHSAG